MHNSPATVGRLQEQFQPALPADVPDNRERKPLERILKRNRGHHLGKLLEVGSVACRPSVVS